MSSSGNISAIAIIGLTALLAIQLMKEQFMVSEGYQEHFGDNAAPVSNDNNNFTFRPQGNRPQNVQQNITPLNPDLNNVSKHGSEPFGQGGDFFTQPLIADNASANGHNMTPEAYRVYMAQISAATPSMQNFNAISNSVNGTNEIPGPGNFIDNVATLNSQGLTGRAADLSLCAQNMSTMASGTGQSGISSTLLPNGGQQSGTVEGFSDCNVQNVLANQTFLSARSGGVIGTDTVAGSLRNANQSLRSEPPNPMQYVGPWNLSTVYPDLLRRPLEGCGPSFGLYGNGPNGAQVPVKMQSGI